MIGRFGDAYLADWGLATEIGTTAANVCGTPGYVAPEMVFRTAVDPRTDVYLLGSTLHHLLTGELRHRGKTSFAALLAASESVPHDYGPEVPAELGVLANRACHLDPEQRPANALEFRDALSRYLEHRQAAALAAESTRLVERLEALQHRPTDPAQRQEEDRLIAQASFGFERAFSDWSGNERSRSAKATLDALVEQRAARAAVLERQAHDRDPVVGAAARRLSLLILGVFGVLASGYAIAAGLEFTPVQVMLLPLVFYALVVVMTILFRRRLLENAFGRQFLAFVHLLFLAMIVHRGLAIVEGLPIATTLGRDSLLLAVGFSVAAIQNARWLWWIAATFVVAFVLGVFVPQHMTVIYSIAAASVAFIAAGFQPGPPTQGKPSP